MVLSLTLLAALVPAAPPELGLVPWRRGYDEARAEARQRGVPVLVLFDEVPGCATVNAYGAEVLSHPLVVDASALFVPVFVSNNESGGDDRRVLTSFGEPTWNNPVVRVVDADGRPRSPRITHDSGAAGLLRAMHEALGARAPEWLALVVDVRAPETTTYAMGCFWEGEAALGALDEVRSTEPGFVDGREVVRVRAVPGGSKAVRDVARAEGFTPVDTSAGAFRAAPESDDKHALRRTRYARVPMTDAQRARVNAAVAAGRDPSSLLSPTQRRALDDDRALAALTRASM